MGTPVQLNERIFLIDGHDLGRTGRTGIYVILDEKITLIETSASPSVPYILDGLRQLQVDPRQIEYIIVTHIHLDHSGGAGLLLTHCPNAKVVVHPKGARHLIDPSKLIESAKMVYGNEFNVLFNPILPIPEEKIVTKNDQEVLQIGSKCNLTFLDSPGHANHHFSIYDPISNGVFTGDTLGVHYPELLHDGIELFLPSTSPNQFSPEKMLTSVEKIKNLNVDSLYFGHFGMSTNPNEVFHQLRFWLPKFIDAGKEGVGMTVNGTFEEQSRAVKNCLFAKISSYLDSMHIPRNHEIYEILTLDIEVCAMGIVDYIRKSQN